MRIISQKLGRKKYLAGMAGDHFDWARAIKRNCPGTETRVFVVLSYGVSHLGAQDKVGGPKNTFAVKPVF